MGLIKEVVLLPFAPVRGSGWVIGQVLREAERIFAEQHARGATAVRVRPDRPAERIEKFDPEAEQILMIPRVVGG